MLMLLGKGKVCRHSAIEIQTTKEKHHSTRTALCFKRIIMSNHGKE